MDLLPADGGELHDGDRVLPGPVLRILQGVAVVNVIGGDFLVEHDGEPVLEISLYAAMVVGAVSDDGVLVLENLYV